MKENVLDVLMYLFENYMDEGPELDSDQEALTLELSQAGFPRTEIRKAFSWLEGLATLRAQGEDTTVMPSAAAMRIYSRDELDKLGVEARGFLHFLERNQVLDAATRELVIERVMALETDAIELEQLKWVVLMVLFNQPGQEQAYSWMEDLVFDGAPAQLH